MLRNHTVPPAESPQPPFHEGDEVKLVCGTYEGTTGVFLHLNADPKWAEIRQWDCQVRSHPVEWMRELKDLPPKLG